MSDDDTTTITITARAMDTIQDMMHRVEMLERIYGADSDVARKASRSLLDAFCSILRSAEAVYRDDELNLYVRADAYSMGVIFHASAVPEYYAEFAGMPIPGEWHIHT